MSMLYNQLLAGMLGRTDEELAAREMMRERAQYPGPRDSYGDQGPPVITAAPAKPMQTIPTDPELDAPQSPLASLRVDRVAQDGDLVNRLAESINAAGSAPRPEVAAANNFAGRTVRTGPGYVQGRASLGSPMLRIPTGTDSYDEQDVPMPRLTYRGTNVPTPMQSLPSLPRRQNAKQSPLGPVDPGASYSGGPNIRISPQRYAAAQDVKARRMNDLYGSQAPAGQGGTMTSMLANDPGFLNSPPAVRAQAWMQAMHLDSQNAQQGMQMQGQLGAANIHAMGNLAAANLGAQSHLQVQQEKSRMDAMDKSWMTGAQARKEAMNAGINDPNELNRIQQSAQQEHYNAMTGKPLVPGNADPAAGQAVSTSATIQKTLAGQQPGVTPQEKLRSIVDLIPENPTPQQAQQIRQLLATHGISVEDINAMYNRNTDATLPGHSATGYLNPGTLIPQLGIGMLRGERPLDYLRQNLTETADDKRIRRGRAGKAKALRGF